MLCYVCCSPNAMICLNDEVVGDNRDEQRVSEKQFGTTKHYDRSKKFKLLEKFLCTGCTEHRKKMGKYKGEKSRL